MTLSGALTPAAFEDRVELGERGATGLDEVHGLHAVGARGGDVVGVVVDEHRFARVRSLMRAHVSS